MVGDRRPRKSPARRGARRQPGPVMTPGAGPAMVRVAAVIPVVLLVLFTGLLWLLGLIRGPERRRYVTNLTHLATSGLLPPARMVVGDGAHARRVSSLRT